MILRGIAKTILRVGGWETVGGPPAAKKAVLIEKLTEGFVTRKELCPSFFE